MSILIRLYRLCVLRQAENATWDRIFYANPWNIRPPEAHKKIAALNSFHDTICLKHMTFPKVSCPCVAQVCTRRVRNEQIPRINIMSLVVHCDDLPPPAERLQHRPECATPGVRRTALEYHTSTLHVLAVERLCILLAIPRKLSRLSFVVLQQFFHADLT